LELRLKNGEWNKDGDIDRMWIYLRTVLQETAEEVCGKKIVREGDGRKRTTWKRHIQTKGRNEGEDYVQKRNEAKELVKKAKREDWEKFGEEIERIFLNNRSCFWKKVKGIRGKYGKKVRNIRNKNEN
jgi:hypothetical protein